MEFYWIAVSILLAALPHVYSLMVSAIAFRFHEVVFMSLNLEAKSAMIRSSDGS